MKMEVIKNDIGEKHDKAWVQFTSLDGDGLEDKIRDDLEE